LTVAVAEPLRTAASGAVCPVVPDRIQSACPTDRVCQLNGV